MDNELINVGAATVGDRISVLIKTLGIKKYEFASNLQLTPASVTMMCKNKSNPGKQTLELICQTYHVSKDWLLTGAGEMFASPTKEEEIAQIVRKLYGEDSDSLTLQLAKLLCSMDANQMADLRNALKSLIKALKLDNEPMAN